MSCIASYYHVNFMDIMHIANNNNNNNNGHRIQGFNPFTWFALIKIKIESVDMSVFCKIVKHAVL